MRVTWPRLDRIRQEDRGAVLFIVAISLVALIGMLVLTVDLGSLYAERRTMVRAADAAALAAAQECVKTDNKFNTVGPQALTYARGNAGTTITSLYPGGPGASGVDPATVDCDLGYVDVGYRIEKGLFFAPIFGFDTGAVTARARAQWTLPGLVPLTVADYWSDQAVLDCPRDPSNPRFFQSGSDCYVLFDNRPGASDDEANWGWLNISGSWGYDPQGNLNPNTVPCNFNPDLADEVINGLTYSEVSFPTAAWACNKKGNNRTGWNAITCKINNMPCIWNTPRAMPISSGFCNKDGLLLEGSLDPTKPCLGNSYRHIIGFQTALIIKAWDGPAADTCGPTLPAPDGTHTCVHFKWTDAGVNSIDLIRLVK